MERPIFKILLDLNESCQFGFSSLSYTNQSIILMRWDLKDEFG